MQVGAGNARVGDVAHDGDVERGKWLAGEFFTDSEEVKQALCRMFVRAIAGVDNGAIDGTGEEMRGTGGTMANDDRIHAHRLNIPRSVTQRFAFGDGGGGDGEVEHIGGQTLGGEREGGLGAGGILEEEIDADFAVQRGDFFDRAGRDILQRVRSVEDREDFVGGERLQVEQMRPGPCAFGIVHFRYTASSGSVGCR